MTEIATFDPSSVNDIENFNSRLNHMKEEHITDELLFLNLEKLLDTLKKINDDELNSLKCKKLMVLLVNLTFKTKCRPLNIREHIIKHLNLHSLIKKYFTYMMNSNDDGRDEYLAFLIGVLNNLTFESEYIAMENFKNGMVKMSLDCLQTNNYLIKLNSNQLTTKNSLYLFDNIIRFILSNCEETCVKAELNSLNVIQVILDNKKCLDEALKRYPRMQELKIIDVRLVCILACLMDDNELEKYLKVSQEIASKLIQMLNETIKKSKSNTVMLNTKFYLTYEINLVPTYLYARSIMKRFLNICVNDTIKQIIFDSKGLLPILILLQNGNEREQYYCCEVICSLCFNQNIREYLRADKKSLKLIEDILKSTTKIVDIKNCCKQIVEMINCTLEKRLTTNETILDTTTSSSNSNTVVTVMISYNWKYKDQCLRLNEELKKHGYATWIDSEKMSGNLFDGMANAVETSSIVLVCFSEEYRKSANCRLEAEYAFKLNKPMVFCKLQSDYQPQGWIGLLMGQNVFIDLSSPNLDKQINEIVKQIDAKMGNQQVVSVQEQSEICNNIQNWSTSDVQNWLSESQLNELLPVFADYDGVCLYALWHLKLDNSGHFYEMIQALLNEKKVKISTKQRILFYLNFDKLFSAQ